MRLVNHQRRWLELANFTKSQPTKDLENRGSETFLLPPPSSFSSSSASRTVEWVIITLVLLHRHRPFWRHCSFNWETCPSFALVFSVPHSPGNSCFALSPTQKHFDSVIKTATLPDWEATAVPQYVHPRRHGDDHSAQLTPLFQHGFMFSQLFETALTTAQEGRCCCTQLYNARSSTLKSPDIS